MNIAFKKEQVNTANKLLIDFGPKFFKVRIQTNGNFSDIIKIPNTLFHISESRVQNLEREFKDAFALKSGMFTRTEIEAAQLLLQAEERLIDLTNGFQLERAYTNLFELLIDKIGIDFRTDEIDYETWSVFLTLPLSTNFEDNVKTHLNILKTVGFIYINPTDYLTSSFYSQKTLVGAENVKHKYGILVNVSDKTEIGVFDEELIENGYDQLSLGVNTVIEYCLAILRDLNVRGFKRELLEEWVQQDGTCLNDAKTVIKNIRKKDVDIKIILNAPYILFDYSKVTGLKNDINSIPEGIINLLNSHKKIRKNINKILSNVIVVGPGSEYAGFDIALKNSLALGLSISAINVINGKDPNNSEINGLMEFLATFDVYTCYNVTKIEIDDETRKRLEKQYETALKNIDAILKEIKSKNYYYPENILSLDSEMNTIFSIINTLPDGLNTSVESRVFTETQKFAKEFGKQLKNQRKIAEKNLEKAIEVQSILNKVSSQISYFKNSILVQLFTNQLAPILIEVKKNKTVFEEKMTTDYVKTISKVINKILSKDKWLMIEDLANETKISNDVILRILRLVLEENKDVGYLDGRFVKYSMDILVPAFDFLDNLILNISQKIADNDSFELLDDFNQADDYCLFLEGGFKILNDENYLESIIVKKEYLQEERNKIQGKS